MDLTLIREFVFIHQYMSNKKNYRSQKLLINCDWN